MTWSVSYCEDSFAGLKDLPDRAVDVIITDPPYPERVQANMSSGTAMKHSKGGGIPRVTMPFAPLDDLLFTQDLVRVAKRWALMFCSLETFGRLEDLLGKQYVRGSVWYKPNAMGQLTGDRPAACYEGIAWLHREEKKVWNGRGSYGFWVCNGTRGEKGRHPNQKPLELCLKLVALCSNRGETVLDPFTGSGRIGEACVLLGRNYVGFDNDQVWVKKAQERLYWAEEAFKGGDGCEDTWALKLCTAKKADILELA